MRTRTIAFATTLSVACCGSAWADEAAEKALETKVDELQKQLDQLNRRLDDGSSKAGDELSERVAELEKVTKKDKDGLFAYWGNGIRLDSANGAFKLKIGGRLQSDWTWFYDRTDAEQALDTQIEAGEEFRRARLMVGGQIYKNIEFSGEYDFAGGAVALRDCWLMLKDKGLGNFQVGNMKEPTGTEELTSDLFIPFLERSAGNEAFAPDYKAGFMWSRNFGEKDAFSVQAGVFRDSAASGNDTGNGRSGDYNYTARIAGRPWVNEDGTSYLHLGVAGSLRSPSEDSTQFRARPELHLAPRVVDTGAFDADDQSLLEADAGFVAGPVWVFGDFFSASVDPIDGSSATFNAWQLAAGWFLTGESKPYKTSNSTFDRVKPKSNFDGEGGAGAWELAARVSGLDLNDGDIEGGKVTTVTVGVSWYLNPNTRVMLDWVHAKQKDADFNVNGVEMRFQIDF